MDKIWDVIIIGSGPSGLTAGIYTTRGSLSTLVLAGERPGGQLMLTTIVDNFPGFPEGVQGPNLMAAMREQAENLGAEFVEKDVQSADFSQTPFVVSTSDGSYQAHSVVIATGADAMWLNVPGERELIGRGVSSCAPCDAPFFKDKKVVVVGGGDAAMEEAIVLSKFASEVTLIHRKNAFRASAIMQKRVMEDKKIKILWNTEVKEVLGKNRLEKIVLENTQDESHSEMNVDGMFVAIGHIPNSKLLSGQIELDEKGYIKKDESGGMRTNIAGVFVAGDVHDNHYRQAITAAGFGCMAGMEVINYLDKKLNP